MNCPKCLCEVPADATRCPYCAHSFLSGDPLIATPPARVPAPPPPPPPLSPIKIKLLNLAIACGVVLIFAMAYLKAKIWSHGNFTPEARGYLAGAALTPLLISWFFVWLANRKKNPPTPGYRKGAITVSIAFLIGLFSLASELPHRKPTDQAINDEMAHLLRQAAGTEPVQPDKNWYDGPARAFFVDVLKFRKDYVASAHAVDRSSLDHLYATQSYADKKNMQTIVVQLNALLAVDKKYESLDPLLKDFETRIQATNASQYEKDEFVKGFHKSFDKLAARQETFRLEEEWLTSSADLYEFVIVHSSEYKIRDKKLIFKTGDLVKEFEEKQSHAMSLRKQTIDAKHRLDETRQAAMSQMGVTPKDLRSEDAGDANSKSSQK